jgi:hypothetical protein
MTNSSSGAQRAVYQLRRNYVTTARQATIAHVSKFLNKQLGLEADMMPQISLLVTPGDMQEFKVLDADQTLLTVCRKLWQQPQEVMVLYYSY